ncbi:hypothetical protein FE257_001986, partial [Aspergillus nanangensis]
MGGIQTEDEEAASQRLPRPQISTMGIVAVRHHHHPPPAPAPDSFPSDGKETPPFKPEPDNRNPPPIVTLPIDPNLANPRLLINRACIYERHLPANTYITAHVQRLQHGHYSSSAVSDRDFDHVDFLSVNFIFHSPNTNTHRFKAATIRASVACPRDAPSPKSTGRSRSNGGPRFLKHAPHLLYGTVSPETLQWNYSLTGSLGVAELPLMASVTPSGSMNGRYRRYEMMRIQGSVRSLKSPRGRRFDVDAGELVWTLEENNLQRSGLPREFTFAMLIQKPHADSRLQLALEIDPMLQCGCIDYPDWWLGLSRYRAVPRRSVDFRVEIGQRFEPAAAPSSPPRGFNFATLESSFDDYVHMPGKKFTSNLPTIPDGMELDDDNQLRNNNPNGDFSLVQPVSGIPQLPYPPGAMAGIPGQVPMNAAGGGPMLPPGFNPGGSPMRAILAQQSS